MVLLFAVGGAFVLLEVTSFLMIYPTLLVVEKGPEALGADTSLISRTVVAGFSYIGVPASLFSLLGVGLVLQLARQVANYVKELVTQVAIHNARRDLQVQCVTAYLDTDISFYFRHNRAEIMAAISTFPAQAALYVGHVFEFITSIVLIVTYVGCLTFLSPWLSLVCVAVALPTLYFVRRLAAKGNAINRSLTAETLSLSNRLYEDVQGMRIIKMRGAEQSARSRFVELVENLVSLNIKLDKARLSIQAYSHPILMVLTVVTFYLAVTQLGLGLASLGVFVLIIMRITPYFGQINLMRFEIINALDKLDRYRKMLDAATEESTIESGDLPFDPNFKALRICDVAFSYQVGRGGPPAVNGVSFEVRRGEIVALVGRSGAGKSTLADMIPRFLKPDSGDLYFDDTPLSRYDLLSLRRAIAFVSQDSVFFDDSIRNNVTFGLTNPPNDAELREILEEAYCWDFVAELTDGVDTVIGDRGIRLSVGQRQRLSLARALAAKPSVLVLDEPTSALDSESEAHVQRALSNLHGKVTVIVIAHRLATIRHADAIAVLDKGKLVGFAPHDQLLETSVDYRRLFESQMSF